MKQQLYKIFIQNNSVPKDLSSLLNPLINQDYLTKQQSAQIDRKLISSQDWTKEQKIFVEKNIFTTYDKNNYLHQLHIALSPSIYLLDVKEDTEMLEFSPPSNAHIVVRVQHQKPITIIERRINNSPGIIGIEMFVQTGNVQYMITQQQHSQNQIVIRHANMSPQTAINWHIHLLGGNNTYHEIATEGSAFVSYLYGTYIASPKEHLYMHYKTIHSGFPGGESRIMVHGIGLDQSYSNFYGNITIGQKAAKTTAHLEEHCLLFSPSAKHDTMPTLQIDTNDVVASHSASTTQINEDELFYMATRGLPKTWATKMILQSFLAQVYNHIPIISEKENIQHYIDNLDIHV
jgi:hypothetical protein